MSSGAVHLQWEGLIVGGVVVVGGADSGWSSCRGSMFTDTFLRRLC